MAASTTRLIVAPGLCLENGSAQKSSMLRWRGVPTKPLKCSGEAVATLIALEPWPKPEFPEDEFHEPYSHAAAVAKLHDVALVIGSPSEHNVREANGAFRSIEVIGMPLLERIYAW